MVGGRRVVALVSAFAAFAVGAPASAVPTGPPPAAATTTGPAPAAAAVTGGYVAVSPARLLDTRTTGHTVDGQSQGGGPVPGGTTRTVQVTGRGGVPASSVAAVVLNVTAVRATAAAYVTVFPAGETRPNASNLNVVAGDVSPNLVVVKVGGSGGVSLYLSTGSADLLADVAGYYPTGGSLTALSPGRLLDTRATGATVDGQAQRGGAIGSGLSRDVQIAGRYGIPTTGVDAVILNVTGVRPTAGTYATVWPTGAPRPNASNLNLKAGEVKPNLVVAKLGTGGRISIFNASGSLDVLADVAGFIPTGTTYSALTPARLLDTRTTGATVDGVGQRGGAVGPAGTVDVQVTGRAGIPPTGVTAVVLNVTGVAPTASTFVTAYPAGEARPNASNLNLRTGEVRPNLVFAKVGSGGRVTLFNSAGSLNLLADVAGWFGGAGTPTGPTITTATVANGTVGVAYSQALTATGGSAPYTWSVTSGSLPPGLTLGPTTGTITGTPTTSGQPTFTVEVKDSAARTGSKVFSIRVDLPGSGQISGTVTDAGGTHQPLGNVTVTLQSSRRGTFRSATTDSAGHYAFAGLRPSTDYHVCFQGAAATGGSATATGYQAACHAQNTRTGEPGDIPVPSSTTVTVDRALVAGSAISGTVTDETPAHAAVGGVRVAADAYDDAWQVIPSVLTAANGTYVLKGLRPGSYSVCFSTDGATGASPTGYLDECWDNAPYSFLGGTPVTVGTGTRTGVSAALAVAGAVSGTVTDAVGTPVAGIGVSVSGASFDSVVTAANGTWKATGLRAGSAYTVCFSDFGSATGGVGAVSGYLDECWDDKPPGAVATPVVVTAGSTRTGVDAALAAGGRITGTVTNAGGTPLQGVSVAVDDSTGSFYGWATTAANGTYTVRSVPAGTTYRVCFDGQSVVGAPAAGYAPECWNDKAPGVAPTPVTVPAAGTASGVNAALAVGGVITGTVRNAGGTTPLLGEVRVTAQSSSTDVYLTTTTASNGTYALHGLPTASDYRVCFDGRNGFGGANDVLGYVGQCWNNQPLGGTPTPVSVTTGTTRTGVDANLVTAGAVSGTVTQAGSAAPLAGVRVTVRSGTTFVDESAVTNVDGRYTVNVLTAAADYTVCFSHGYGATGGTNDARGYVDQCWNAVAAGGTPTPVAVTSGSTRTGINAALGAAGAVSGKVTDAAGTGLAQVEALVRTGASSYGFVSTLPDGTYTVGGLPPGTTYTVCFDASFAAGGATDALGYLDECWNNQPTRATATPVAVTAGATTPGIGGALSTAGGISGTVTASGGAPLGSVGVTVHSVATGTYAFATTAPDGTWRAGRLPAGTDYKVCFSAAGAVGGTAVAGYVDQCWSNKATEAAADPVTVTLGSSRTGVNATLLAAGGISGTVTEAGSGATLGDVGVTIRSTATSTYEFATTAANGTWSVKGLPPGTDYTVCFDGSAATGGTSTTGHLDQCWNNKATQATADKVTVTSGAFRAGVDAALVKAGAISGRVTAATGGAALAGVDVTVESTATGTFDGSTTAADGTWSVTGLAPGTDYVVCFGSALVGGVDYFGECWNNQPSQATATKVTVAAGVVTANVNGTLERAGGISGRVTAATGGANLAGVDVTVESAALGSFDVATSAADGTWSVAGLAPGSDYTVCFADTLVGSTTYYGECWNDQPTRATATKVVVTGGAVTANVNGTLATTGGISGTVTADGGGALASVDVTVTSNALGSFDATTTAADGTWSITGLAPGTDYVVCFDGFSATGGTAPNGYGSECWDNQPDSTTATPVTVSSGTTRTGVDAGLAPLP